MAHPKTDKSREKGQAFLEAIVGIPALVAVLTVFVLCLAVFSLRIHLVFVTQELASCRLSLKDSFACENQAHQQTRRLLDHWGFHDISILASSQISQSLLKIQATWGDPPLRWSLRWSFREGLPFQAPD